MDENDLPSYPPALDFATVNDWVHSTGRHFEALQGACLGMAAEIDRLRSEVEVQAYWGERWAKQHAECERLRADLAASQAREKARIEALRVIAAHPNNDQGRTNWEAIVWESIGFAEEALALPADDTALRTMLVQEQEEIRERCIEEVRGVGGIDAIEVERCIRALEVKP